ncbi:MULTISPECIES: ThuA domain-containing protein [Paenibacillus]|uniref:ThuA domain-containing protein n=1 Tax=Paenibacillus TaxID=44249 RepID=UPI0022B9285F|nr:ThuA domain-containing protein [Paenibacillus caseinilyticus]MCZ8520850.1 ThuA domain-containing protein [Paenibacillus caseinilyticus]
MENMKSDKKAQTKALLLGDYTDAPWHPLEPAQAELQGILGEAFELMATENYDVLVRLEPAEYPLCIAYTDCWRREVTKKQAAGLLRYVAGGGGLLVIHNGISLQSSYELLQMIGAEFTGHPPYQHLRYYGTADGHPLLEGVEDFALEEEPYLFAMDPFTERNIFLEFEFEGRRHPAGWEHAYGLGRVVYLQPGHHAASFRPEAYRRLIRNSAGWAAEGQQAALR